MSQTLNSWIDMHAHLNMLKIPVEEALQLAKQNQIIKVLTIGTCPDDNPVVYKIAKEHFPFVQCCLGAHPHDAEKYTPQEEEYLLSMYDDPVVVGVGEIGLDYYYDNAPRETQRRVFRRMLEISIEKSLPVQIHTRDAESDTVEILKEFSGQVRGLLHCFTGSKDLCEKALDLGLNISLSGIVTFKSANELREVAQRLPLDRLHVETDAPFLTPVPHRGKNNHPAMVVHTAEFIAQLKGVSMSQLSEQTHSNAKLLFSKLVF